MTAHSAIAIVRRHTVLAATFRFGLAALALAALTLSVMPSQSMLGNILLLATATAWFVLAYRSAREQASAAEVPAVIAAGRFDQAERLITEALRRLSVFGSARILTLHHLALLRHEQKRHQEAALICQAVLHRLSSGRTARDVGALRRHALLLLCESMLAVGDLNGAHRQITALWQEKLPLQQAVHLLSLLLDYLTRIGAFEQALHHVPGRVLMTELMSPANSAKALLQMSLAARRCGRDELSAWLHMRAQLVADLTPLLADPALAEFRQPGGGTASRGDSASTPAVHPTPLQ